jgi:hypothetical protein
MSVNRVLLNYPTNLSPLSLSGEAAAKSWIQLAKTGKFVSNRYGAFEISKQDLSQMLHNFQEVTPKAPTELPIDFDHLSMAPQKPGDGIAAGWLKKLELRNDGDELWGLVAWTPNAAERIRNQEYRFVSPSFVKDHTHTDGTKIGTTLLAAAITNHPYLQSMAGLVLSSDEVMGHLAINETGLPHQEGSMTLAEGGIRPPVRAPFFLAETGQRVTFVENEELTPELSPEERAAIYQIVAVRGEGETAFVKLQTEDGTSYGWFPASALSPAAAPTKATVPPAPMAEPPATTPSEKVAQEAFSMSDDQATSELLVLAGTLAADRGISLSEATKLASAQRPDLVEVRDGHAPMPVTSKATPRVALPAPISLRAEEPTSFVALVTSLQQERKVGVREAISLASDLRPDLALGWAQNVL